MRSISKSGYFIAGIAGVAAFSSASSAFAIGRCGGELPVHSPTTLAEIAQRCNVNLSELYEANTGVDPRNVLPGTRLAIPEEKDRYSTSSSSSSSSAPVASTSQTGPVSTHPYIVSPDYVSSSSDNGTSIDDAEAYRSASDVRRHSVRVRDARARRSNTPVWLQPEPVSATRYSINDRMSYQKMSAMRIHNAGVPDVGRPITVTTSAAAPVRLIECRTLEASDGGKIHQVNKIISTPERTYVEITDTPASESFDCRLVNVTIAAIDSAELADAVPAPRFDIPRYEGASTSPSTGPDYHLPDYNRIGAMPRAVKINDEFSLSGEVTDFYEGCLLLKTNDNRLWRLAAAPPSGDLLGKKVMVWGTPGVGGTCGGGASMVVSHAVYAEPWTAARR